MLGGERSPLALANWSGVFALFSWFKAKRSSSGGGDTPLLDLVSGFGPDQVIKRVQQESEHEHFAEKLYVYMSLSCSEALCSRRHPELAQALPNAKVDVLTFESIAFATGQFYRNLFPFQSECENEENIYEDAFLRAVGLLGELIDKRTGWRAADLLANRIISYTMPYPRHPATEMFSALICSIGAEITYPHVKYPSSNRIGGLESIYTLGPIVAFSTTIPMAYAETTRRLIDNFNISL